VKWRARWQLALLALLSFSLAVPAAAASDANGDDPQVEAAIQEGIALRRAGNDEAALSLFLNLEHNNPDSIACSCAIPIRHHPTAGGLAQVMCKSTRIESGLLCSKFKKSESAASSLPARRRAMPLESPLPLEDRRRWRRWRPQRGRQAESVSNARSASSSARATSLRARRQVSSSGSGGTRQPRPLLFESEALS